MEGKISWMNPVREDSSTRAHTTKFPRALNPLVLICLAPDFLPPGNIKQTAISYWVEHCPTCLCFSDNHLAALLNLFSCHRFEKWLCIGNCRSSLRNRNGNKHQRRWWCRWAFCVWHTAVKQRAHVFACFKTCPLSLPRVCPKSQNTGDWVQHC